jgi:cytochrome c biogenesis protein CcmG, thiol:disulfide interchange protein DsbE
VRVHRSVAPLLLGSVAPLLLAVLALAGCGTQAHNEAPSKAATNAAFKGSPPPLAALHAKANELIGGGVPAFTALRASLRGYPIVINKWASWCDPCQTEFPSFQRASVRYGRQVAFVGVNGKDHNQSAAGFLKKFPVSYPSYTDPNESIARTLQAATYFPETIYINRQGKIVFDHAGPYLSASALERDVRRYALGQQ